MQKVFADFIHTLRQQGVPISPAETLDALKTAELLGLQGKSRLRQGLGLVLAKNEQDKQTYEHYFDEFFKFAEPASPSGSEALEDGDDLEQQNQQSSDESPSNDGASEVSSSSGQGGGESEDNEQDESSEDSATEVSASSPLGRMLQAADPAAIAMAIAKAGQQESVQNIQLFTQKPLFSYRMMNRMGNEALNQELLALDVSNELAQQRLANRLRSAQTQLQEQVKDYVEQQYLLYAEAKGQQLRETTLQKVKLTNIDNHYMQQMADLVRKAAKRLASLHSRKRKLRKRGLLDVRKTIAANAAYDGVLFHTRWKTTVVDRPKVMVICDVSGSVSRVARFLLLFVHSLQEVLPRSRSFVFSSDMGEVTDLFKENKLEDALAEIMSKWANQSTSYDKALADFSENTLKDVDQKTTVIMLGDARNNNGNGRADIWQKVYLQAGRVLWLNPEHINSWDTGDSIMASYRPYCSEVHCCNSLRDLERILGNLLKHS
ncbi:VWA domain-containing protein [uncultured Pseudoteredinibacter sp.]|uniref:VWA domain-containing protein n=1 Tax=uncultured Pseudoteredinibacter sp. TaxID=1641701 RepID=UPI0026297884|nr:VWA domain-containing protein [uncultured Pseudoteredinibacter sp.]